MTAGFTPDQERAVRITDRNLIVNAGAGSGKTRVLVERYLALLAQNPDWPLNALVAITFTRKAAGEMRDRVRRELEARLAAAGPAESDRWAALLAQVDSARIDTIHGLCAAILRANAAEAGIDPDFAVLDEAEAPVLLADVIDAELARIAAEGHPALALFAEYDDSAIRAILSDSALLATCPDLSPGFDLLAGWQQAWQDQCRALADNLLAGVDWPLVDEIMAALPADDKLADKWRVCYAYLEQLRGHDVYTTLQALTGVSPGNAGSRKNWRDDALLEDARAALRSIKGVADAAVKAIGTDAPATSPLDQHAAELIPLWVALVRRVRAAYLHEKDRRAALDFDDLERLTCDLLENHAHVRARYRGAEFRHLLVDEFQDTNAAQWRIVQALAGLDRPGSLFVVGDPKQSIYAFRGADVSVFGAVRDQITTSGGQEIPLATSFRTHAPLVTFFNRLFGRLLVRDEDSPVAAYQVELGDELVAHRQDAPHDGPHVEMLLIGKNADNIDADLDAEQRRTWEAVEITTRLRELVTEGTLIHDRHAGGLRPLAWGDIAVLFQSRTKIAIYEEVFKRAGLPFVTIAGQGYYSQQEVWDLLNLLHAVHNPAYDLALAAALRSPLFNLTDDALLALRLPAEGARRALSDSLTIPPADLSAAERERVAFAHRCLADLRQLAGRVTIAELLREALEQTGYLAVLAGLPNGAQRRGNVEKLLDKAHSSGRVTLGAFTAYLRDLSEREVREGEAVVQVEDAVSLMSVHASKGLEFPLVVLADTSWQFGAGGGGPAFVCAAPGEFGCKVYDDGEQKLRAAYSQTRIEGLRRQREDAERLRQLYVAATRARDRLLISGQAAPNKDGDLSAKGWLGNLLDVLGLADAPFESGREIVDTTAGPLLLTIPAAVSPLVAVTTEATQPTPADDAPDADAIPVLLQPLPVSPQRVRHLAATAIADLGSALVEADPERQRSRDRFRRQVFQDAPATVDTVSPGHRRATARLVGEIVHQALRHEHLPGTMVDDDLLELLRAHAWGLGLTESAACDKAAKEALKLLTRFTDSSIYRMAKEAEARYRELPFIYEREGSIIHGVIDLVLRLPGDRWLVCDYKTSYVTGTKPQALRDHARRYHLQVGIYAEALERQVGVVPEVKLYYVRDSEAVTVPEADWRQALDRGLAAHINALVGEGDAP